MVSEMFTFPTVAHVFCMFKIYKISILNAAMAIETIVSAKYFLRNFLTTISKCPMFAFIVIKPISKFGFCFSNVEDFTTNFTF